MINLEEIKMLNEDVYGSARKLECFFVNIQEIQIHPDSRKGIISFLKDFLAKGHSSVKVLRFGTALQYLATYVQNKPLSEVSSLELKGLLFKMQLTGLNRLFRRDLLVAFVFYHNYCRNKEKTVVQNELRV